MRRIGLRVHVWEKTMSLADEVDFESAADVEIIAMQRQLQNVLDHRRRSLKRRQFNLSHMLMSLLYVLAEAPEHGIRSRRPCGEFKSAKRVVADVAPKLHIHLTAGSVTLIEGDTSLRWQLYGQDDVPTIEGALALYEHAQRGVDSVARVTGIPAANVHLPPGNGVYGGLSCLRHRLDALDANPLGFSDTWGTR